MPKELPQVQGATMTTARELLQEAIDTGGLVNDLVRDRIVAYLAQPEPEPVFWYSPDKKIIVEAKDKGWWPAATIPLYAAQPEPAATAYEVGHTYAETFAMLEKASSKPEPSAEVERIMELADQYYRSAYHDESSIERESLRAEVERLVRMWDGARKGVEQAAMVNKLLKERAERAEAEEATAISLAQAMKVRAETAELENERLRVERQGKSQGYGNASGMLWKK